MKLAFALFFDKENGQFYRHGSNNEVIYTELNAEEIKECQECVDVNMMTSHSNLRKVKVMSKVCNKNLNSVMSIDHKVGNGVEILIVIGDSDKVLFEQSDWLCIQFLAASVATRVSFLEHQGTNSKRDQKSPSINSDSRVEHARDLAKNNLEYLRNRFAHKSASNNPAPTEIDSENHFMAIEDYSMMKEKLKRFRDLAHQLMGLNKLEMDQLAVLENVQNQEIVSPRK